MKVYYAHCQSIYGTPQAERDRELLNQLFDEVIDPEDFEDEYAKWLIKHPGRDKMSFWLELSNTADAIAFRALPDGRITEGVWQEVYAWKQQGKLVIELPSNLIGRRMSIQETMEYLIEVGQR